MSVFHNASASPVRFRMHQLDGAEVTHTVAPGDEVSVPDVYDQAVIARAPQMRKGHAPEPAPSVAPPPPDPKRTAKK